jgi:arylformamidase
MLVHLDIGGNAYQANLAHPLDIALPLNPEGEGPIAFYAPAFRAEAVRAGTFIGDTGQGGVVNFKNVFINPHGNGTHTECVGHISKEPFSITHCLRTFHFPARLVTVLPQRMDNGDRVITEAQIADALHPALPALILRTQPNGEDKCVRQWSGTNPPYLDAGAARMIAEAGVDHLLLDLPSVDREEDEGRLSAHRAFWGYPSAIRSAATITEMVYVPDNIPDGLYLLNLQIVSFVLDVSPSKPVLYPLQVRS